MPSTPQRPPRFLAWTGLSSGRLWAVAGVVVLLLAAAGLCRLFLDASVPPWVREHTLRWGKGHWPNAVEKLGKFWPPLWLFMVWALAAGRKRIALAGLLALLLVAPPVGALKYSVCRLRPYASPPSHWTKTSYSFPSGDAAQAFATAVVAAALMRGRWRALPFAAAAVVAGLRVLMGRHYPSDALAGAAVGLVMGLAALAAWRAILRRPPSTAPPAGKLARAAAWFWRQPRRPAWLAWIVLGLPIVEGFASAEIAVCLRGFGPFLVAALLLSRGEAWLRFLRGRVAEARQRRDRNVSPEHRSPATAAPALVLVALASLAILPSLGWMSLTDRDEGYYAECAREMVLRRDPLVPHFAGKPWMEKPPLLYWFMALSLPVFGGHAFGADEFAMRLPSALFGLLCVWLVYRLGRDMFNRRAGALAACALAVCPVFALLARLAMLDTGLTAALLIAMLGFWRFLQGGGAGALFLFYLGCGLGALAKGPLGLALPAIAVAGYAVLSWRIRFLWSMRPLFGALVTLAVVGAWAVPAGLATKGGYFYELVWERTLVPIFTPMQGHGGGDLAGYLASLPLYIPVILAGFAPWTCWLAAMTRNLLAGRPAEPPSPAPGTDAPLPRRGRLAGMVLALRPDRPAFLAGWLLAQLAAFSLVRSKLPHHILPLLPALALASGWLWDRAIAQSGRPLLFLRRAAAACLAVAGAGFAAAAIVAPLALGFGARAAWFAPAALASLACGLLPLRHVVRRPARAAAILTAWAVAAVALLLQTGLPALESAKSPLPITQALRARYGPALAGLRLGASDYREKSLSFYARAHMIDLDTANEVNDFLSAPGPAAVVLPHATWQTLLSHGLSPDHATLFDRTVFIPENGAWRRVLVLAKP